MINFFKKMQEAESDLTIILEFIIDQTSKLLQQYWAILEQNFLFLVF